MIQYVDDNLAGITALSLSSSNVTLSSSQARMCMLRMTGTITANLTITNANNGVYLAENVTSGNFTINVSDGVNPTLLLPQGRRFIVYRDAANGPRIVSLTSAATPEVIPSGTPMLFYQAAAPTGWTIYSALNDYALSIVSSGGGTTSGSVNYSTLFGRTAVDASSLTIAQMPPHTHVATSAGTRTGHDPANPGPYFFADSGDVADYGPKSITTTITGNGNTHTHAVDMRVRTATAIIATRN